MAGVMARCPPAPASWSAPPPLASSTSPSPLPRAAAPCAQRALFAGGRTLHLGAHLPLQRRALSAEGGGAGDARRRRRRRRNVAAGRSAAGLVWAAEGLAARGGKWEARFAELEEYRARFGDCKVPRGWEESPSLGRWVDTQRTAYKKGTLEASRQLRLEGLGLVWDAQAAEWEARYADLEEYKARFGDCNVPNRWEENRSLGRWVDTQRKAHKKGTLEASRQQRLEGLGFVWDAVAAEWEARYAELEEYRARFGDCNVPRGWEENSLLGTWVNRQRTAHKKGVLEASRQQRLEELGLVWDALAAVWEARYAELEEYKARFGDCDVPNKWEESPPLGEWVSMQRKAYKKGVLEASRQQRLEELGLVWDAQAAGWEARYAELEEYKARFGDCMVPQGWEECPALGAWVSTQRAAYRKGRLEELRQERLEELGLVLEVLSSAEWEVRYAELEEYKARFEDSNVPQGVRGGPSRRGWVKTQRQAYKKGALEASRQERLERLGIVWEVRSSADWEARFSELVGFWQDHGTCDVPESFAGGGLARWVEGQRDAFRRGRLVEEEVARLQELGFQWVGSGEGAAGGLLGAARWVRPGDEEDEDEGEEDGASVG